MEDGLALESLRLPVDVEGMQDEELLGEGQGEESFVPTWMLPTTEATSLTCTQEVFMKTRIFPKIISIFFSGR